MKQYKLNKDKARGKKNRKRNAQKVHGIALELFGSDQAPDFRQVEESVFSPSIVMRAGHQEYHALWLFETALDLDEPTKEYLLDVCHKVVSLCDAGVISTEIVQCAQSHAFLRVEDTLEKEQKRMPSMGARSRSSDDCLVLVHGWTPPRLIDAQ